MRLTSNQFDGGGDVAAPAKIKVSQATVDNVKNDGRGNMGQAAANKVAYGSPAYVGGTLTPNAPVSAEYKEATKRVYPNAKATSPGASSGYANPKAPGNSKAAPKAALPPLMPPSASGATNPNQPGPKATPKSSAFPPILPTPSKPTTKAKPNSAATMPPTMTPPTSPKNAEKKAATPAKIKVSQATVDAIKSAGKEKAIGATKYKGVSEEYKEGVRRIYQSKPAPKKYTPPAKPTGGKSANKAMK
jgi:hypothetical protein